MYIFCRGVVMFSPYTGSALGSHQYQSNQTNYTSMYFVQVYLDPLLTALTLHMYIHVISRSLLPLFRLVGAESAPTLIFTDTSRILKISFSDHPVNNQLSGDVKLFILV